MAVQVPGICIWRGNFINGWWVFPNGEKPGAGLLNNFHADRGKAMLLLSKPALCVCGVRARRASPPPPPPLTITVFGIGQVCQNNYL